MPTSACCRRSNRRPSRSVIPAQAGIQFRWLRQFGPGLRRGDEPAAEHGYTLIEMVVVLAIVSLLAGLAAPRLYRAYQAVTRQTEQDAIVAQLARLALRANALGVSFVLDTRSLGRMLPDGRPLVALPGGWQLSMDKPIRFNLIGVCEGGAVRLTGPDDETHEFTLEAPACEVREGAQAARL